jgi:type F conjugative transfer system protein TrbI
MTTTLHAWMTRLSTGIGQHPFAAAALFFFGIGLLVLWAPAQQVTPPRPAVKVSPLDPGELDRALVTRYETRFDALQAQVQQQQQQLDARDAAQRKANDALQQQMEHGLADLRQLLTTRQTTTAQSDAAASRQIPSFRHLAPQHQQQRAAAVPRPQQTLEVVAHPEDSDPERPTVQLPAGSFAPSTILTGAYAPADQERPLPVLIRVNAGFTGPNHTRVPLHACFVIGKAAADLGTERAAIQTARLSCTLPSGRVFEQDVSGYVVAHDGFFGVPGKLVRQDAAKIGMASLTGFLSGAAQALSRAESTTVFSPVSGATFSAVTGDTTRYAAYAGLADTANQLSRYYLHLANQITPAIAIPADEDVHLVMNEGVTIDGYDVDTVTSAPVRYVGAAR